jgi:hypothetical protein
MQESEQTHWLPRWLERRSWWVKWSFAGGLGLLSAFLPTVLGLSWQQIGVAMGVTLILIAVIGGGWEGTNEWRVKHEKSPLKLKKEYVVATCGLLLVGVICYLTAPKQPPDNRPALLKLMEADFPGTDELRGVWEVHLSETTINYVQVVIHSDIRTMTKFVTFYVPNLDVFESCKHLSQNFETILRGPSLLTVNGKPVTSAVIITKQFAGDPDRQTSEKEKFTGAVYIYYEGSMSDEQRVELRKLFADKGANLMFRGHEFLGLTGTR